MYIQLQVLLGNTGTFAEDKEVYFLVECILECLLNKDLLFTLTGDKFASRVYKSVMWTANSNSESQQTGDHGMRRAFIDT